jgi:hypothetical protein
MGKTLLRACGRRSRGERLLSPASSPKQRVPIRSWFIATNTRLTLINGRAMITGTAQTTVVGADDHVRLGTTSAIAIAIARRSMRSGRTSSQSVSWINAVEGFFSALIRRHIGVACSDPSPTSRKPSAAPSATRNRTPGAPWPDQTCRHRPCQTLSSPCTL